MTAWRFITCSIAAAALGPGLQAQSLDRTDPTQEEETRTPPLDAPAPPPPVIETARAVPAAAATLQVGAIVISGAREMRGADFVDLAERYGARTLSPAQLEELTQAVAGRARQRGYVFATAWIEPQSLDAGVLRVRLDEGVIDEIRISGEAEAAVRPLLEPLRDGRAVRLADLERRVLLAEDVAGVWIRRTRYERDGDKGILHVDARRSRFSGYAELANDGSRPIGPQRVRLDLDANGVLMARDALDVSLATVPFEFEELMFARARYGWAVGTDGLRMGITGSYSRTEPGAYLEDRDILGRSWRVGVDIRRPLRRTRAFSMWIEGELELRDLRQQRADRLVRHDRIPALRTSLYSVAALGGGTMRGKLTFSSGLDILDATQPGDPLASRDDASVDFHTLHGWLEWLRPVGGGFSLEVAGRGQLATDPLLATEDIGLGGNRFARGYDFSERFGDEGLMGYGELRYDWADAPGPLRRVQFYAYADGGVVGNLQGGFGGGSLASGGGGLRADLRRDLDMDLVVAVPLTGPRYDTDDRSPRVIIRAGKAF